MRTERLAAPLATEDYVVQTMVDVSPTKWHLAHVTWFFETFILTEHAEAYRPFQPEFAYLFNSYYLQAGERHCRDQRGYISRPTVAEVYDYRAYVEERMRQFLEGASATILTMGYVFGSATSLIPYCANRNQVIKNASMMLKVAPATKTRKRCHFGRVRNSSGRPRALSSASSPVRRT